MTSTSAWQKHIHVTFIILCMVTIVMQFVMPAKRKDKISTFRVPASSKLDSNLPAAKVLETKTSAPFLGVQIANKTQPIPDSVADASNKNIVQNIDYGIDDFGLEDLPSPDIKFIEPMLAGWDKEAEKLISEGDLDGLVGLKMRISAAMQPEICAEFLKADSALSLLNASVDLKDAKLKDNYLKHSQASLEALHRVNPDDPYYFIGKGILCLRQENDKIKAINAAQEGLNLIRSHEKVTSADIYYDWRLTQLKSICLSVLNKNEDAIKAVMECKKRAESLPENRRDIIKEMSAVIDSLQQGKKFSQFVPPVQSLINSN